MILSYTSGMATLKRYGASASLSSQTNGEDVKLNSGHRSGVRIPSTALPSGRPLLRLRWPILRHHLHPPIRRTSPNLSNTIPPTIPVARSLLMGLPIPTIFTDIMVGMRQKLGSEECTNWIRRYRDEMHNHSHH